MTVGDDFFNPDVADYVQLAGVTIDAPAMLTAVPSRDYKWDEQGGAGLAGAWLKYTGNTLSRFTIQFTFMRPEDITLFDTISNPSSKESLFKVRFQYKNGRITGVHPLDIVFPPVNQLGVTACVVEKRGAIAFAGGGKYTCDVSFIEYKPPPKRKAAKVSEGPLAGKKDVPPLTDRQRQIQALTAQVKEAEAREAAIQ